MMEQSSAMALIFGVMFGSALLGAAAAVWFEMRKE